MREDLIERLHRAAKTFGDSQAGRLYEEAAAALEAAREDAERYRWLRDEAMRQKGMTPAVILATENFDVEVDECGGFEFGPDLDAAIDQARGIVPEAGQGGGDE